MGTIENHQNHLNEISKPQKLEFLKAFKIYVISTLILVSVNLPTTSFKSHFILKSNPLNFDFAHLWLTQLTVSSLM